MKIKNPIIFILGILFSFAVYGIYVYASGTYYSYQSTDMDYTSSKTVKQAVDELYEKVNSKVWRLTDNDHNGSVSAGDRVRINVSVSGIGQFDRTFLIYNVSGGYAYGINDPIPANRLEYNWVSCGPGESQMYTYYLNESGVTSAGLNLLSLEDYNTYHSYFRILQDQGRWWLNDKVTNPYGTFSYYAKTNPFGSGQIDPEEKIGCRHRVRIPVSEI